ncbi:MAG: hypothetical protein ACREOZ_03625 [Gloeomargaritales cyanobacterium]
MSFRGKKRRSVERGNTRKGTGYQEHGTAGLSTANGKKSKKHLELVDPEIDSCDDSENGQHGVGDDFRQVTVKRKMCMMTENAEQQRQ